MLELLKKIGIPATVAAVIASLVTMVPLLFKLDERYAKEEDLTTQTARTEKVINELTVEISRLAGTQQVMVALMAAQPRPAVLAAAPAAPVAASTDFNNLPPSNAGKPSTPAVALGAARPASAPKLDDVSRTLREQQSRLQSLKY